MNFSTSLFLGIFLGLVLFKGQDSETNVAINPSHSKTYPSDSLLNTDPKTDNIISPKVFEEDYKNKYKTNEFDYTATKPKESIWEKINRKINNFLEAIFGKLNPKKPYLYAENIIKIISIIILGISLYFLVKFLLNKNGNLFFSKRNKEIDIYAKEIQENIHEINFIETISHYENIKNFRLAVRYQFLYLLKIFSDQKVIDWNPEKTNHDYILEIQNPKLRKEFHNMVKIFEYVWYGDFDITETEYWEIKNKWKLSLNAQ